jgi:hypothetical protein
MARRVHHAHACASHTGACTCHHDSGCSSPTNPVPPHDYSSRHNSPPTYLYVSRK